MPEMKEYVQGLFCWLDLGTTDVEAAKKFYTEVFGWTYNDAPMGEGAFYSMALKNGIAAGGIYPMKEEQKKMGIPPHWMSYIAVDKVDDMASRIQELGGTLLAPPFDVFDAGRMLILQDPTGAVVALWEGKNKDNVSYLVYEPGAPGWNELLTTDTDKAAEFYTKLLGLTAEKQTMGDVVYTTFKAGETMAGGMMAITPEMGEMPPHWSVYITVADCDGTVEKAASSGGKVLMPPTDIPDVGRVATLMDPQGAVISLVKFEMKQ